MAREREISSEIKLVQFDEEFYPFRNAETQSANFSGIISRDFQLDGVGTGHVVLDYSEVETSFPLSALERAAGKVVVKKVEPDPLIKVIVAFNKGQRPGYFRCRLLLDGVEAIAENANREVGPNHFASFRRWKIKSSGEDGGLVISVGSRDYAPHYDFGLLNDLRLRFER